MAMSICVICGKLADEDDVVEYTDGTSAHGECHDSAVEGHYEEAKRNLERGAGTVADVVVMEQRALRAGK